MYEAITENDLKTVRQLLKSGEDPNEFMFYAAELGHLEICKALLNSGAKIIDDYNDINALHNAIDNNKLKICELFCKYNNKCLFNSLHYAIDESENIKIIKLLLRYDANINEYDDFKNFPLEICIDYLKDSHENNEYNEYHINVYKLLLNYGANINILNANTIIMLKSNNIYTENELYNVEIAKKIRHSNNIFNVTLMCKYLNNQYNVTSFNILFFTLL